MKDQNDVGQQVEIMIVWALEVAFQEVSQNVAHIEDHQPHLDICKRPRHILPRVGMPGLQKLLTRQTVGTFGMVCPIEEGKVPLTLVLLGMIHKDLIVGPECQHLEEVDLLVELHLPPPGHAEDNKSFQMDKYQGATLQML